MTVVLSLMDRLVIHRTPGERLDHTAEVMRARRAARNNARGSVRRSAKLQRTPPWADLDAILLVYNKAAKLTRETGIPHHVDHVIPLRGKTVSGLHVAQNLQILRRDENLTKSNKYDPWVGVVCAEPDFESD